MELIFKKERRLRKDEKYFISYQGEVIFEACYDSKASAKELYDPNGKLLAQGYYWWDRQGLLGMPPYVLKFSASPENRPVVYAKTFPNQITWFEYNGDRYSSYYHFGWIVSIFKNDTQIASYRTENDWSNGWNMILTADDDVDKILLTIYALHIYSGFFHERSGPSPSLNLAFWSKKPNLEWQPKRLH